MMHSISDFRELYQRYLTMALKLAKQDKFLEAEDALITMHKALERMILENKHELEKEAEND